MSCPHTRVKTENLPLLAEGSEHSVYFNAAKVEVLKVTKSGIYGDYYELIDGRIHQFQCTPVEYLIRMLLLKKHFGFSQQTLGITDRLQIVSRQKFIVGDPPSQEVVDTFLKNAGLIPVKQRYWLWRGVPRDGLEPWVGDARADNFVITARGIVPIDLRMWQVAHSP